MESRMFPYYEIGVCFHFTNIILIALCIFLLVKDVTQEKCKRMLFYPCLIFAILCGILIYVYLSEIFVAYYSGGKYEMEAFKLRITGPYAWVYILFLTSIALPISLFVPSIRKSAILVLSITVITYILGLAELLYLVI